MTSDSPLISVCMPVYNAERYAVAAIESILGQTLGDFEFLILDDGSTDSSLEILRRYAGLDPRIRVTSRPNRGVAASLNELVDQSRGEFLARMDADDIAVPERFARQVEYLRARPECVLVGSRVRIIDPDGDPLCEWCTEQEHEALDAHFLRGERGMGICHPSVMMRRDAVLAIGKYRAFANEDTDLWLRLSEYGRIANMPEVLLDYRVHAGNVTNTMTYLAKVNRAFEDMIRDARRRRNLPEAANPPGGASPPMPARPWASPVSDREIWAWWALGAGHVKTARKHARRVLAREPLSTRSWKLLYCALRGR